MNIVIVKCTSCGGVSESTRSAFSVWFDCISLQVAEVQQGSMMRRTLRGGSENVRDCDFRTDPVLWKVNWIFLPPPVCRAPWT